MRNFALLTALLLTASCSSKIGTPQEGTTDARSIDFRDPPEPKEGSGTSPGCEGVTARGECQQGSAVYCDLDRGRLRRVDCEALGQNCILDISRGAVCKSLDEQDTGAGSGAASQCSDTGISEKGFCTSSGEAVYCDTSGTEPVTRTWDCKAADKTCGVDDCAAGAFCCGEDGGNTSEEDLCAGTGLDFDGVCEGDVATWCSEFVGPQEKDCSATGQRCEVDTCATGAFCCGDVETTGDMTPAEECAAIGFEGVCDDELTLRYCFSDELEVVTCSGERTCQVDACINGAGCCEPAVDPVTPCEVIGFEGICRDDATVEFCDGEVIEEDICEEGFICEVDEDGWAFCNEVIDPCADLGVEGICPDENTLHYCLGGELTVVDCASQTKTCQVDACITGIANCCE